MGPASLLLIQLGNQMDYNASRATAITSLSWTHKTSTPNVHLRDTDSYRLFNGFFPLQLPPPQLYHPPPRPPPLLLLACLLLDSFLIFDSFLLLNSFLSTSSPSTIFFDSFFDWYKAW